MKKVIALLGGGRTGDVRSACIRSFRDIGGVLGDKCELLRIWIDEHGFKWLKNNDEQVLCTLQGNRLIKVNPDEMVIGTKADMVKVDEVWPLFYGRDYGECGLLGMVDFAGFDIIGTGPMMSYLTSDNDLLRLVFKDLDIDNGPIVVNRKEWMDDYLLVEDGVFKNVVFPVQVKYSNEVRLVSVKDNFSNVVFSVFEENEVDHLDVFSLGGIDEKLCVGFLGNDNFLPSRVGKLVGGDVTEFDGEAVVVRNIQNMVIEFVRKYKVNDYGLFWINNYNDSWKIADIELRPSLGRDDYFSKLWKASGLDYEDVIKKIVGL